MKKIENYIKLSGIAFLVLALDFVLNFIVYGLIVGNKVSFDVLALTYALINGYIAYIILKHKNENKLVLCVILRYVINILTLVYYAVVYYYSTTPTIFSAIFVMIIDALIIDSALKQKERIKNIPVFYIAVFRLALLIPETYNRFIIILEGIERVFRYLFTDFRLFISNTYSVVYNIALLVSLPLLLVLITYHYYKTYKGINTKMVKGEVKGHKNNQLLIAEEVLRYKRQLDEGTITLEEFKQKKKELLGV